MQQSIVDLDIDFTCDSWRRFIRQGALLLDPDATTQTFFVKGPLSKKSQYIQFWLLSDKLVLGVQEKKAQKYKLFHVFSLTGIGLSSSTQETDGMGKNDQHLFFLIQCVSLSMHLYIALTSDQLILSCCADLKKYVIKLLTDKGLLAVYTVDAEVSEDWVNDLEQAVAAAEKREEDLKASST